jgi:glutamine synthetase
VLCSAYTPKGEPIPTNTRHNAAKIFAQKPELEPWFGIEQEYVMFKDGTPLGWPKGAARGTVKNPAFQIGYPGPQGPFYCSAGADVAFGREIVEEHLFKCLYMGIQVSGTNAEVMPGSWEYQVGPAIGISAADQHVMSRFILARVCEKYGVVVTYEPKPVPGDWNGSGAHTNFSSKPMREEGGLDKAILPAVEKLGKRHKEHIAAYGTGNEARLTGAHETASMEKFSWGIANRGASIRVGNDTAEKKKGYLEDRRPAANMDPYIVTSMIYETIHLL